MHQPLATTKIVKKLQAKGFTVAREEDAKFEYLTVTRARPFVTHYVVALAKAVNKKGACDVVLKANAGDGIVFLRIA